MSWPVLAAATRARVPRLPLVIEGRRVGSVAAAHRPALRAFEHWVHLADDHIELHVPEAGRDAALSSMNQALREQGLLQAWRDETIELPDPSTGAALARMERAAARFWGTLTRGAHATGYVAGADGRPAALWVAQRSPHKPTDPGLLDNLVGGGVPAGQTPAQALVREAWEEAGLQPHDLAALQPCGVLCLQRDVAEGFQFEWLHAFDLEVPAGLQPVNQDGEVAGFTLMPVNDALACAQGDTMTVDAALVTLDFALRHGLIDDARARAGVAALKHTLG